MSTTQTDPLHWRQRLGMGFVEFWNLRAESHATVLLFAIFLVTWASMAATMDGLGRLVTLVASFAITCIWFLAYGIACLVVVPLLPLMLVTLVTVGLEAWWRVRTNRPYMLAPATPTAYIPPPAPPPVQAKKRGGWFIPLALGLWIGSTWGSDD